MREREQKSDSKFQSRFTKQNVSVTVPDPGLVRRVALSASKVFAFRNVRRRALHQHQLNRQSVKKRFSYTTYRFNAAFGPVLVFSAC